MVRICTRMSEVRSTFAEKSFRQKFDRPRFIWLYFYSYVGLLIPISWNPGPTPVIRRAVCFACNPLRVVFLSLLTVESSMSRAITSSANDPRREVRSRPDDRLVLTSATDDFSTVLQRQPDRTLWIVASYSYVNSTRSNQRE